VKSVSLAGDVRDEMKVDGDQPSGLGWLPDGSLLVVSMLRRQLLRRAPNGRVSVHADLSKIATFHCNDMVVDSAGRAYVGNFGFDLEHAMATRGIDAIRADRGVATLACVLPDGTVRAAATELHFPNGTVITPDGKTLIVGETFGARLTAFDIGRDGALSNRRLWASTAPRVPDGIALDANGDIWIANPTAAECALIAPGGRVVEVVDTGQPCYACMLGGADGRTLFMLTAPALGAAGGMDAPNGKVVIATVDAPHAGLP